MQVLKDEMQEHYHGDTNVLKNRSFVTNLLNQEFTPAKTTEINNDEFDQPQVEEVRAGTWVPPQRDIQMSGSMLKSMSKEKRGYAVKSLLDTPEIQEQIKNVSNQMHKSGRDPNKDPDVMNQAA